jgi:hypothetical protein
VNARNLAIGGSALVALAVVLTPWYALDAYEPNGWDATWWARGAALAALVAIVALRLGRDREAAALIVVALGCVAYRVIAVPDFGFGFDGLDVPVERRWGLFVALAGALVAAAAVGALLRRREPAVSPESAVPG